MRGFWLALLIPLAGIVYTLGPEPPRPGAGGMRTSGPPPSLAPMHAAFALAGETAVDDATDSLRATEPAPRVPEATRGDPLFSEPAARRGRRTRPPKFVGLYEGASGRLLLDAGGRYRLNATERDAQGAWWVEGGDLLLVRGTRQARLAADGERVALSGGALVAAKDSETEEGTR